MPKKLDNLTPWLPNPEPWAVSDLIVSHDEALFSYGEYCAFVLFWNVDDHESGLVERCAVCVASNPFGETYKQPLNRKCPNCFGTGFANPGEAGFKAFLVRPALFESTEERLTAAARGEVHNSTASSIQSTTDFRQRTGDIIIRADNMRWKVDDQAIDRLHTGFEVATRTRTLIGYNYSNAHLIDHGDVAYLVPPTDEAAVLTLLDLRGIRYPADFSTVDVVNGPVMWL